MHRVAVFRAAKKHHQNADHILAAAIDAFTATDRGGLFAWDSQRFPY